MDFSRVRDIGLLLVAIPLVFLLVGMVNKVIADSYTLMKSNATASQQSALTNYQNTINESKNSWVFWLAIIIFATLIIYIIAIVVG